MVIHLNEIPQEGRSYQFNQKTAELNEVLQDLLEDRAYVVESFIRPISGAYEIATQIQTQVGQICSQCAVDFEYKINQKFRELLYIEAEGERNDKGARANHMSDMTSDAPFCYIIPSQQFDIGEYIHELIATSEPTNPRACEGPLENCPNYQAVRNEKWFQDLNADKDFSRQNPFEVLKNLKLPQ